MCLWEAGMYPWVQCPKRPEEGIRCYGLLLASCYRSWTLTRSSARADMFLTIKSSLQPPIIFFNSDFILVKIYSLSFHSIFCNALPIFFYAYLYFEIKRCYIFNYQTFDVIWTSMWSTRYKFHFQVTEPAMIFQKIIHRLNNQVKNTTSDQPF